MPIPVRCACGKSLNAPDGLAGKRAKCPGCGSVISIPAAAGVKPAVPKPAPAPRPAGQTTAAPPKAAKPSTLAPAKPAAEDLHAHASCPNCNAFVSKKDAICVQCGMNLVTGKKLTTVMSSEPTGPARSVARVCLVLNLLIPGAGTLMGGGSAQRMHGLLQVILFVGGILVANPIYPDLPTILNGMGGFGIAADILGPLLAAGGLGWALMSSLRILKNAKPA